MRSPVLCDHGGALDGVAVEVKQLSHEDVTGVGYGICTFHPGGSDENRRFLEVRGRGMTEETDWKQTPGDPWVQLAGKSLESYILMCFPRMQEPGDAMSLPVLQKGEIRLTHSSIKTKS